MMFSGNGGPEENKTARLLVYKIYNNYFNFLNFIFVIINITISCELGATSNIRILTQHKP